MVPKATICIPSYNYDRFIGDAIRSVLNQTYDDFELIVIDDCSSDESEAVITSFSDCRLRLIKNEENLGITKNWNRCLSHAKGDYICIMGADDVLRPDFLRETINALECNRRIGFVHCSFDFVDENGLFIGSCRARAGPRVENGLSFFARSLHGNPVMFSSVLFRKECFATLGTFNEALKYTPDWEMLMRVSLHYDVGYINSPLACYRLHGQNLSSSLLRSGELLDEGLQAIDIILDNARSVPLAEVYNWKTREVKAEYLLNHLADVLFLGQATKSRSMIRMVLLLDPSRIIDFRVLMGAAISLLGKRRAASFIAVVRKGFS